MYNLQIVLSSAILIYLSQLLLLSPSGSGRGFPRYLQLLRPSEKSRVSRRNGHTVLPSKHLTRLLFPRSSIKEDNMAMCLEQFLALARDVNVVFEDTAEEVFNLMSSK